MPKIASKKKKVRRRKPKQGTAVACQTGVDLNCPNSRLYMDDGREILIRRWTVTEAIDDAVTVKVEGLLAKPVEPKNG